MKLWFSIFFSFLILILAGLLIILQLKENGRLCENFFNYMKLPREKIECYWRSPIDKICRCSDGLHLLNNEMIIERNIWITGESVRIIDLKTKSISDNLSKLNFSQFIISKG